MKAIVCVCKKNKDKILMKVNSKLPPYEYPWNHENMHFIVLMNWRTTKKGKTWLSPLWLSADISTTGPIIKILKRVKYGTTCFGNRTHHYYSEWMVIWIQSCRNSLQIWKLPIFFLSEFWPKNPPERMRPWNVAR